MASTFSTNLHLELQGTGDNSGTWGVVLNNNALNVIDQAMGGVQSFSLSSSNVVVTTNQSQNNGYILSGVLTSDVTITWPAIGRTYFIANNATGAYNVTLKAGTGVTTQVIPQGASGFYVLNVNDVLVPTLPGVPTGGVSAFAMQTPPAGWLECNGSAVSRSTYATLFTLIGTTYGSGDGSTTFNIPDLRAYFIRGWDHGRGVDTGRTFGSNQSSQNLAHSHTGITSTNGDHQHTYDVASQDSPDNVAAGGNNTVRQAFTSVNGAHNHSLSVDPSGGADAHPLNVAMIFAIRAL